MRHNYTNRTIFDNTRRQIAALNSNNRSLQKKAKIPTVPAYRGENFPDSATYGQLVTDRENNGMMWIYAEDDKWHPVGGFPRIRGTKKWGGTPTYSEHFSGAPPGSYGTGESILIFDADEIYNNDWNTFAWIWDTFDPFFPPPDFASDKMWMIKRGGTYTASYRIFVEHTGNGITPPWFSCSGQTQMYEPDFEAWVGYERYHRQLAGSIATDFVTYTIPYDLLLNYWPPDSRHRTHGPNGPDDDINGYYTGGGIEQYVTYWLWGIDDDPDYGNEFETSFVVAKPGGGPNGWFQGTYFELIRIGDSDIMEHYDNAYEGIGTFSAQDYPFSYPYPPAEETDMPVAPVIEGMEMHNGGASFSVADAPVLAALEQAPSPTVQGLNFPNPNRPANKREDTSKRTRLEDQPDAETKLSVVRKWERDGTA